MISKRGFLMLTASALLASAFAAPPPPPGPHGRHLPPGAKWCSKCGGDGYNRAWYGAKRFCHICDGKGWIMVAPPPPPAPHAAHHPGPVPKGGHPGPVPKGGHPGPAGKPGPGPKGGPR